MRHSLEPGFYFYFFWRGGYFLGGLAADCLKNANASWWLGAAGQECRYWYMYKHYLQLQKPTPRYHDLRVHPYARFKTNKPKDVLDAPAQDASCGGSGSVVGFSTNMLEAGKENVGGIGTRQECGDALPRCNLACGLRLRLRLRLRVAPHTHLTSPRFPSSRPVSYPYALVGGLAFHAPPVRLATLSYSLAPELGESCTAW